jgi:hypothetical protein
MLREKLIPTIIWALPHLKELSQWTWVRRGGPQEVDGAGAVFGELKANFTSERSPPSLKATSPAETLGPPNKGSSDWS